MTFPFFSIIIPVYNGLSHDLHICLDHIWKQSLSPNLYEVICIDDCSTDNTRIWLSEEQKKHPNLHVLLNESNIRQGGARNRGIKAANGNYIMFIDQDDYYHNEIILEIYNYLKDSSLEVLVCDSAWQRKGQETNALQLNLPDKSIMSGREFVEKNGFAMAPWRMILKKDFVLKYNLFFEENVRIEDIDWGCRVTMLASQIQYFPVLLVHYNRYEDQTTGCMKKNFAILYDQFFAAFRIFQFAKNLQPPSKELNHLWQHHYYVALRMMCGCYATVECKVECLRRFCGEVGTRDKLICFAGNHSLFWSVASNLSIPFYQILIRVITWIKWKTIWKPQ